jgi:hypothetical protein
MGLTTWKNAPSGLVRKGDVAIAKNYLNRDEIDALNRIVSAYLEFAELQAKSRRLMHMADWIAKLDDFLKLSDRDILTHLGKITHKEAEPHAHAEFARFDAERRRLEATRSTSDFDKAVEEVQKLGDAKAQSKKRSRKKRRGPPRSAGDRSETSEE